MTNKTKKQQQSIRKQLGCIGSYNLHKTSRLGSYLCTLLHRANRLLQLGLKIEPIHFKTTLLGYDACVTQRQAFRL